MQACFEFFAGATVPIPADVYQVRQKTFPYGAWALPTIETIVRGELLDRQSILMPVLYVLAPRSKERRAMTGWKFVDYELALYVEDLIAGNSQAAQGGARAILEFYGMLDQIAALIRGSTLDEGPKALVTPSYPRGAAIKFGEEFSIEEVHGRAENTIEIGARILIKSTEQVSA